MTVLVGVSWGRQGTQFQAVSCLSARRRFAVRKPELIINKGFAFGSRRLQNVIPSYVKDIPLKDADIRICKN